mgnify:CR=1 FL=1
MRAFKGQTYKKWTNNFLPFILSLNHKRTTALIVTAVLLLSGCTNERKTDSNDGIGHTFIADILDVKGHSKCVTDNASDDNPIQVYSSFYLEGLIL